VLLNFWASWCSPCQSDVRLLEHANHTLAAHHGTVLGVTFMDHRKDSVRLLRLLHATYPQLRDVAGRLAAAYGTAAVPESFLIDRRGRIRAISRGEVSQAFIAHAVTLATAT
jgi:cytochrome c biogenesis protein CcmG, thiol:disulfide interchange protein DsbE